MWGGKFFTSDQGKKLSDRLHYHTLKTEIRYSVTSKGERDRKPSKHDPFRSSVQYSYEFVEGHPVYRSFVPEVVGPLTRYDFCLWGPDQFRHLLGYCIRVDLGELIRDKDLKTVCRWHTLIYASTTKVQRFNTPLNDTSFFIVYVNGYINLLLEYWYKIYVDILILSWFSRRIRDPLIQKNFEEIFYQNTSFCYIFNF